MELIVTLLYIFFVLAAIVLVVVVLLQEGKGGGLTDALGSAGQQTFGVGASGIHKFTGWTAAVFLASALGIHYVNRQMNEASPIQDWSEPTIEAPAVQGAAPGEPATPPAEDPK